MTELGPRGYLDTVSSVRLVVGVTGRVPETSSVLKGWTWDLSLNRGDSKTIVRTTGQLDLSRLADAVGPSMLDDRGVPICVRTAGDPRTQIVYRIPFPPPSTVVRTVFCVPLDLLAPAGSIPKNQLENVVLDDRGQGEDRMRSALAHAGGRLVTLPHHGEISMSLGGDYRGESGEQAPPAVASSGRTTDNTIERSEGKNHLFEGYSELAIVPIAGHPIAQRVEVDLGVRALRHSAYGASATYKAGGLFRTVQGIAVRGTYATAFRAPTLRDTILGRTQSTPAAEDPCDTRPPSAGEGRRTLAPAVQAQCTAQGVPVDSVFDTNLQTAETGGNPDLKAERAATVTFGVVVEPPQIDGLALSADYWHIAIDDAIETLGVRPSLPIAMTAGSRRSVTRSTATG